MLFQGKYNKFKRVKGLQNQVAKLQAQIKILDNQLEIEFEIFERKLNGESEKNFWPRELPGTIEIKDFLY